MKCLLDAKHCRKGMLVDTLIYHRLLELYKNIYELIPVKDVGKCTVV